MTSLPRRYLPSISSLRALEALDRLGSVTAVAHELNLTQGAVSRQLQTLEAQLGVDLIIRDKKTMRLTSAAEDYTVTVRESLKKLSQAALRLQIGPADGSLNLAILPTFGMRWLVPRLADFAKRHPDVTLNMSTRLTSFDFATDPFDAALRYGQPDWVGCDHLLLMPETLVAVCAPKLKETHQITDPSDLLQTPLLHIESRPDAWKDWFSAHGVETNSPSGTVFDQFSTIIQAAHHGLGVALLPSYLVEQDLLDRSLVRAWDTEIASKNAYYLVWPKAKTADPSLMKFTTWLAQSLQGEDDLPR